MPAPTDRHSGARQGLLLSLAVSHVFCTEFVNE
jgi:hypothetical protein